LYLLNEQLEGFAVAVLGFNHQLGRTHQGKVKGRGEGCHAKIV
jgi:hypothetical protein